MASRKTNGSAIRELRKAYGMSLEDLATAAGVNISAISRLERGEQEPRSPATVRAIADRLGVALDAITYPVPDGSPEPEAAVS